MNYDILAERVRYFKENEEEIRTMCKAMEDRLDTKKINYNKNHEKPEAISRTGYESNGIIKRRNSKAYALMNTK